MKQRSSLTIKAISIVAVGIAFFLCGCAPKKALEKPLLEPTVPDYFSLGEQEFEKKNYDQAARLYEMYLLKSPKEEKTSKVLYRLAWIHYDQQRFQEALSFYQRIIREYPDHPEIPVVKYDIATIYYRLGDYTRSGALAREWLENYPYHFLKGEICFLIGKNSLAARNKPNAFEWWLKAAAEFGESTDRRHEISAVITGLIRSSSTEDLKEMLKYALNSDYAPVLYHQLATLYLAENKLDQAKKAANALIQSTQEQSWIDAGRRIIGDVGEKMAPKEKILGCLLPLTGPFAIYGQETLNGIQLGMGLLDNAGGPLNLQLVIKDTQGKAEDAVMGVEELGNRENVLGIIGPLASKPVSAAARKAQELGIPIITLTQKEGIASEGDMVFRNSLTPSMEVKRLLHKAITDLGIKQLAILYPENPYGRLFMNLFWETAEEMGGVVTAVESYQPDETDFTIQIKKMTGLYYPRPVSVLAMLDQIKFLEHEEKIGFEKPEFEKKPEPIVDFEAVFIPDNHRLVALLAPQFPFHNIFGVRFLGTSLWQSTELIATAADYVQGAIFPSGFFPDSPSPEVKQFVDLYRDHFETEPGILAANGYDTINLLKDIFKEEKVETRKDLQEKLLKHDHFYGVTGKISFDQEGKVKKIPFC